MRQRKTSCLIFDNVWGSYGIVYFILGVGAKIFTIAGPVIVYGVSASVIYGFIYWLCTLM